MNFIVVAVLGYLLNGPLQSDFANLPQSPSLPRNSALPLLIPGTRAHVGLLVALAFVPALLALDRSLIGYRLRLFSVNPTLAKRASVDPKTYVTWLITFGGAGAGFAGWMQVAAIDHRLYPTVASPIGYAGLFVALLGALHPLGSVVAALLLGALLYGGAALQVGAGVSPKIIQVFLGLILFITHRVEARRASLEAGRTMEFIEIVANSSVRLMVPLLLAALGEVISERAWNDECRSRRNDDRGRILGLCRRALRAWRYRPWPIAAVCGVLAGSLMALGAVWMCGNAILVDSRLSF